MQAKQSSSLARIRILGTNYLLTIPRADLTPSHGSLFYGFARVSLVAPSRPSLGARA